MVSVSCIVPTYKRIDQTLSTLDLILASDGIHSIFELEVLVVDATLDESLKAAVLASYGDKVKYIHSEHEGIAINKNVGAKASSHPILIFCDSDMEVEKNTILGAVDYLRIHPSVGMVGGFVMWKGGPNDKMKDRPHSEDRMIRKGDTAYIEAIYSRFIATYRDIFWQVGGYDEEIFKMSGEGADLSIRYWRAGYTLAFYEGIVVHRVSDILSPSEHRSDHPEWGIARDFLLLGYKYKMFESDFSTFASTVSMNFSPLGMQGAYRMLQGIGRNLDQIAASKMKLDVFRATDTPVYDFKFLEIFSNAKVFEECVGSSESRIGSIHRGIFT
jgi:GT2 family glycosyltransferase